MKAVEVFIRFIRWMLKIPLNLFYPLLKGIGEYYGIELRRSFVVYGRNRLIIEDKASASRFIPRSVYFNTRSGDIFVGKESRFGENVMVIRGKHLNISEAEKMNLPLHAVLEKGRDIYIGRNCFLGAGSIILGNVKIGDYAVVAAGAVVTRDVPEKTLVAGVPARVIRNLSNTKQP